MLEEEPHDLKVVAILWQIINFAFSSSSQQNESIAVMALQEDEELL